VTKNAIAVRLCIDQGDPIMARLKSNGFPTLRILSPDGAVLGTPGGRDVDALADAAAKGKAAEDDFQAASAKADVSTPEARLDLIGKYLARGDGAHAKSLEAGFDPKDASEPRLKAVLGISQGLLEAGDLAASDKFLDERASLFSSDAQKAQLAEQRILATAAALVNAGKLDAAAKRLEGAEKTFTSPEEKVKLDKVGVGILIGRLNAAFNNKDKALCFKILDQIAEKYPTSEIAKKKAEIRKTIEQKLGG
jgi:hypothetical protein